MDSVRQLFSLASSAVAAKTAMRDAATTGQVVQYHRTIREHPEYRAVSGLVATKKQLLAMAEELRKPHALALSPEDRELYTRELQGSMENIAKGTLLWAESRMRGETG